MRVITCDGCGETFSNLALTCPHCGQMRKKTDTHESTEQPHPEFILCKCCNKEIEYEAIICPYCRTSNLTKLVKKGLNTARPFIQCAMGKTREVDGNNRKLVPCRICEREIAQEAEACPNCGIAYPGKSAFGGAMKDAGKQYQKMASIIAAILLCFLIVKCNSGG